jgi:hypothetical protein
VTTNIDLTNRALAEIGTRSQITAFNDGSQEGLYAGILYPGLRDFLLREGDYEFASNPISPFLVAAPPEPWVYAYAYPSDCVRLKQMVPASFNILDPAPMEFSIITIEPNRVVATKVQSNLMIYTSNTVAETLWDSMFTESFVRMLASGLAFALENRMEASQAKLQEAVQFAGMASLKDG